MSRCVEVPSLPTFLPTRNPYVCNTTGSLKVLKLNDQWPKKTCKLVLEWCVSIFSLVVDFVVLGLGQSDLQEMAGNRVIIYIYIYIHIYIYTYLICSFVDWTWLSLRPTNIDKTRWWKSITMKWPLDHHSSRLISMPSKIHGKPWNHHILITFNHH